MKSAGYFFCFSLIYCCASAAQAHTISWVRQFGPNSSDEAHGVFADESGYVYTTGYTGGDFFGPHFGREDIFITKHDANGVLQWKRQVGTVSADEGEGIAVDGFGNVYVSGRTYGDLDGVNAGESDAFLMKFDSDGVLQWTRQLGTKDYEASYGVSVDEWGDIYLSSNSSRIIEGTRFRESDTFLTKFDLNGTLLWTRQFGTNERDFSSGVYADQMGYVYVSGSTRGNLGGTNAGEFDVFVSKFDLDGTLLWTRQSGSDQREGSSKVTTDGQGNVYISGTTRGNLVGPLTGVRDPFLIKYDADGTLLWARQFGTEHDEEGAVAISDEQGNVYVAGYTQGSLGGTNIGDNDVFIVKFDSSGNLQWSDQIGTTVEEESYDISTDGLGNVYIAGMSKGSLDGAEHPYTNGFLLKISDTAIPEPTTSLLIVLAGLELSMCFRCQRDRCGT